MTDDRSERLKELEWRLHRLALSANHGICEITKQEALAWASIAAGRKIR